ncbi:MAG TPA: CehA/McbA family metallohydrolase [Anaerolineaceae bacterium]|nr:CehA/McbA family metallohydrolase [Anaerolineaceae bacterium]
MEEIQVGIHMHTRYSDGHGSHTELLKAALKAGLDAIIVTDHNVLVQDAETYMQEKRRKVLLLIGEEVHDQTLKGGGSHLLVFGHNRELARFAPNPQALINQATSNRGLTFIAHPYEDTLPAFGEAEFGWRNWDIKGFTGIELWNQLSEFKTRSQSLPTAIRNAFFPRGMMEAPLERTVKLWDELLLKNKQPVVAIAGNDAHNLVIKKGPFKVNLYSYEFHFRSFSNHLVVPNKLSGEINQDRSMIYDALASGHTYLANDQIHSAKGFRFTVNTKDGTFFLGDRVDSSSGLTFQVRLPIHGHIRLFKDGKMIKESWDREVLTHITTEPGIYRVEVYQDYLGKHRAWIFSNPIYAF